MQYGAAPEQFHTGGESSRVTPSLVIVNGRTLADSPLCLRLRGPIIVHRAGRIDPAPNDTVIDALGGTIVPGLHDHHLHLRSAAAALESLDLNVRSAAPGSRFDQALRNARIGSDGWVRAVGYHDSMAGHLDRSVLDGLRPDVPVRVQHRSGAMWFLNSLALRALGFDERSDGRLFRLDSAMRQLSAGRPRTLTAVGDTLSSLGVTGCTDATPDARREDLDYFDAEISAGRLRQRLHVLAENDNRSHGFTFGGVKKILDDRELNLDEIVTWIDSVHAGGQPVAVHCVTAAQLILTTVALKQTGTVAGDRIEHAAMVPFDMIDEIRDLGIIIVTQPNFVAERGDQYLADIDPAEQDQIWRIGSLLRAGIPLASSTDCPFGDIDPWASMKAAVHRTSPSGRTVASSESVSAATALALFTGSGPNPHVPRRLEAGHPADLCILGAPPRTVLAELSRELVRSTIIAGDVVFDCTAT